jgi:hypothetical protein
MWQKYLGYACATMLLSGLWACTSVTIDEVQRAPSELVAGESVIVLGRRTNSDYETEPELVSCIGTVLADGEQGINVVPEHEFVDELYPWFEPRTAPLHVGDLQRLLGFEPIAQVFEHYKVHYIVWVDGNTEKTRSSGSISCGLSAGFGGCFGFGTWDKKADYEASIWDYQKRELIGKVSSSAEGTSYMPAIVVPIPIIAPVQADACKAMAAQLQSFFKNTNELDENE